MFRVNLSNLSLEFPSSISYRSCFLQIFTHWLLKGSKQFEYSCFLLLEIRAPYVKEGKQFQTWFHSFTYLFPNTNLCFQSSVSALVLPIWSCLDSCFWHLKVSHSFISLKEFSFFKPSSSSNCSKKSSLMNLSPHFLRASTALQVSKADFTFH